MPYHVIDELTEDELGGAWDAFVAYCERQERAIRERQAETERKHGR